MFIPKKSRVFDKLVNLAALALKSAETFKAMVNAWDQLEQGCSSLKSLEKQADEQVRNISDDIESRFILPLDKEDMSELTVSLDDLVDNLEEIANRLALYKIPGSHHALRRFSDLILKAVEQVHHGIQLIKEQEMKSEEYARCCQTLRNLEDQGDQLHREVLGQLLGEGSSDFDAGNVLSVIKWKDVFQTLEDTLDRCEDISVIFSRLRIKYP
jgi:hypothetical protein